MIRFLSILMLVAVLSASCEKEAPTDLRDYYFPLRELNDGLVYEYRDLRYDSLTPDYWYYLSIPTDSAYYLTKTQYQNDFLPQNLYREEMQSDGIVLRGLYLFEKDQAGKEQQVHAEILSPEVFPFDGSNPEDMAIYQVRFQLYSQPNGTTTLLINRKYQGDTTYVYQQETYPAIYFDILGSVDQRDSIMGDIEPHFSGKEIYVKGIGLVYYERNYGDEAGGFQYQLMDRYSMQELEKKAEVIFNQGD